MKPLPKAVYKAFKLEKTHYKLSPPFLGKGTYGICCSAINTKSGMSVAIKKVNLSILNENDLNRILREIRLLRHLEHQNLVKLFDLFFISSELYMVFERMETNLEKIISSDQELSTKHVQYFMYQILKAIKFIHSGHIIHRDLKPANLLLNSNCHLKLCDFGLATYYDESTNYTKYVVTRWYRAPELLMKCEKYNEKIDIWSCGCILGELLARKPLYRGRHFLEQLNFIISINGTPSDEDLRSMSSKDAMRYIKSLPKCKKKNFYEIYQGSPTDAIDLLEKMLVYNPSKRINVEEALQHRFFRKLHNHFEESICHIDLVKALSTVNKYYSKDELKIEFLKELMFYNSDVNPSTFLGRPVDEKRRKEMINEIQRERIAHAVNRTKQINQNLNQKRMAEELRRRGVSMQVYGIKGKNTRSI